MKWIVLLGLALLSACTATPVLEETTMQVVVIETNMGAIEVELDSSKAPITVKNFLEYMNEGHFEGTIFHRVIPGFMIQGGGFDRNYNQKATNSPIKLESDNGLKNTRGTIAMARTSVPDSATSQFFINTKDNTMLDRAPGNDGYAVFGRVVSGMEVVDKIEKVRTDVQGFHRDWPTDDIVINRVYLKN